MNREQEAELEKRHIQDQLEQLIENARADIERIIAMMEAQQHEGEGADQIDALKGQLAALDTQSSLIQHGSMAMLTQMQLTLPSAVKTIRTTSQSIAQNAGFEIGMHLVEMNVEQIQKLQLAHDQQSAAFMDYETKSANRIEQLAQTNGVDISGYRSVRSDLQADIEEAKRRGDRLAQFKAEATLAHINLEAKKKVGGSDDEIAQDQAQADAARERYLKEAEIEALQSDKAKNLSGEARRHYINEQRLIAAAELDDGNAKRTQQAGLTSNQRTEEQEINTVHRSEIARNVNQLTDTGAVKAKQAAHDEVDALKKMALEAGEALPIVGQTFEVAHADIAEPKQPPSSPVEKQLEQHTPPL